MSDIIKIDSALQVTGGWEETRDGLIARFIADQDIGARSKSGYANALKQYFEWVRTSGLDITVITRVEILRYKDELMVSGKSMLTVGTYITVVRRFYEWAESLGLYPANVARGVKVPHKRKAFRKEGLTAEQCRALVDHFRARGNLRDTAMINLMLRTGLRTIEVSRLLVGDIVFKGGKRILMVHGKGHHEKDNYVMIDSEKAYGPIREYLATRPGIGEKNAVFASGKNADPTLAPAISPKHISEIAKAGLVAIGLDTKQYTAHSLRHSAAINLIRSGASMQGVQEVLRHRSVDTTAIYTESIKDEMRILNNTESLLDDLF